MSNIRLLTRLNGWTKPFFTLLHKHKSCLGPSSCKLSSLSQFPSLSLLLTSNKTHHRIIITINIIKPTRFPTFSLSPSHLQSLPHSHLPLAHITHGRIQ